MKGSGTLNPLGGAVKAALDAVVENGAAGLSVADAGTEEAFLDAWTRTLTAHARYLRAKGECLSGPVAVIYSDDCAEVGARLAWASKPMLGGSPADPLGGTLAVGTGEIGGYVKPVRLTDTDTVTAAIRDAGLGTSLTVVLLSEASMVIWPRGLDSEVLPFRKELDDAPVVLDLAALDHSLEMFYERAARQSRTWWKDRSKRITVEEPESEVQHDLWNFLLGKFSDVARVKKETTIGHGRADITVTPIKPDHASAVLELKVTRDFRTPKPGSVKAIPISLKANIDWAQSGVAQTAAYRDDESFEAAYLCVYDFCAGKKLAMEKAIQDAAAPYNVIAKRYWITASHEEHRSDRYPLMPPGTPPVTA
ncbi:hypothetical protein ACTJKJ_19110 [Roseateles sp. 22389]|uniref:hypothetical protein n=1 Tax=Roseateles sp. 22389 TaxID=3453916 RepID=UPI003F84EC56